MNYTVVEDGGCRRKNDGDARTVEAGEWGPCHGGTGLRDSMALAGLPG